MQPGNFRQDNKIRPAFNIADTSSPDFLREYFKARQNNPQYSGANGMKKFQMDYVKMISGLQQDNSGMEDQTMNLLGTYQAPKMAANLGQNIIGAGKNLYNFAKMLKDSGISTKDVIKYTKKFFENIDKNSRISPRKDTKIPMENFDSFRDITGGEAGAVIGDLFRNHEKYVNEK